MFSVLPLKHLPSISEKPSHRGGFFVQLIADTTLIHTQELHGSKDKF
jgi:hypothetical protein